MLQLLFSDKSINQFFHYGLIIIAELFNGFELLQQLCIFMRGFNLLIFITAY